MFRFIYSGGGHYPLSIGESLTGWEVFESLEDLPVGECEFLIYDGSN